ncbi:MAG: porphobilinogen synthase [Acidobacteriota bacterium]
MNESGEADGTRPAANLIQRCRRLRGDSRLRRLVRETRLAPPDLIAPLFVCEGQGIRRPIPSLPGQYHLSVDRLAEEAASLEEAGVAGVILFGLPDEKDERGSGAYAKDGVVQRGLAALGEVTPGLLRVADVCLCEYTDHGHCGVLREKGRGGEPEVLNDATLPLLARTAVSQARAGADVVAPSDMMDGRVAAIRRALDRAGFADLPILSYAAKYASSFYGPFREAAASAPRVGHRRGYQMDPANSDEALREVRLDLEEGADLILVKPALPYLDVVRRVRDAFQVPLGAYQVSGEYAMVVAAAEKGLVDRRSVILESLLSIRRAGADFILSYFAREAAGYLAS